MDSKIKRLSLTYALASAVLLVLFNIYVCRNRDFTNIPLVMAIYFVPLLLGFAAQIHAKVGNDQYLSFKEGVAAFIIVIGLSFLAESTALYIMYNHTDPELKNVARAAQLEVYETMKASSPGAKEPGMIKYDISNFALNTTLSFLKYAVAGIIMALILKKNRPQ